MLGRTKGLDTIQYFPPKASYFLVIPIEDCRGNIVGLDGAEERSMKQEGSGAEHSLWKNDIAPGHNVNRLKSIGSIRTSQIWTNFNPQSVNQKTQPEVAEQP